MNDAYLLDVIQKIIQNNVQALKLSDIAFATVTNTSPLSVQLQTTMQDIPSAALIETVGVKYKQSNVVGGDGGYVVINEGLNVGDRVVMLRVSGGQRITVRHHYWGSGENVRCALYGSVCDGAGKSGGILAEEWRL